MSSILNIREDKISKRSDMKAKLITALVCVLVGIMLAGCEHTADIPIITTSAATREPTPTTLKTSAIHTPTLPDGNHPQAILADAIANLKAADSFEIKVREVRAYHILQPNGATRLVYGEFDTRHAVIRSPSLKVRSEHNYRYDPQSDFHTYTSYLFQENGGYFTKRIEDAVVSSAEGIQIGLSEPLGGDVYQTLITHAGQAECETISADIATFTLDHPKWHQLKMAIGIADLGFLYGQQDGAGLVEQYVKDNYPGVQTIRFTIHVSLKERAITKVEIDDSDFLTSLWAETNRALVEQGADPASLSRYAVLDENMAEYHFGNFNHVHDFDIPRHQ